MGMTKQTTVNCVVMDKSRQRSTSSLDVSFSFLDKIFNQTKSDDLKKLIEDYSHGKVIKRTQAISYTYDMPEKSFFDLITGDMGMDLVDQKAILIFRNADTGKSLRWSVPAPKSSLFERVMEKGLRVKEDKGGDIATKLKNITGMNLQFVRGYHVGKQ